MITVKIICDSGDTFTTSMDSTLEVTRKSLMWNSVATICKDGNKILGTVVSVQEVPPGFEFTDEFNEKNTQQIYFIEAKGKDISFDRWRFELYYAKNYAMTHFEPSQAAADAFMAKHAPLCYPDYDEFSSSEHGVNHAHYMPKIIPPTR